MLNRHELHISRYIQRNWLQKTIFVITLAISLCYCHLFQHFSPFTPEFSTISSHIFLLFIMPIPFKKNLVLVSSVYIRICLLKKRKKNAEVGGRWDICYLLAICQNIFHRKVVDENRILLDSKRECV